MFNNTIFTNRINELKSFVSFIVLILKNWRDLPVRSDVFVGWRHF